MEGTDKRNGQEKRRGGVGGHPVERKVKSNNGAINADKLTKEKEGRQVRKGRRGKSLYWIRYKCLKLKNIFSF